MRKINLISETLHTYMMFFTYHHCNYEHLGVIKKLVFVNKCWLIVYIHNAKILEQSDL